MSEVIIEDRCINLDMVDFYNYNLDRLTITIHYTNDLQDTIRFPTQDSLMFGLVLLGKSYGS